jgi:hypothetical protein
MDKFDLKKYIAEGRLHKDAELLNESAPGYDTRKSGEPLPTLESVKKAYEAKQGKKVNEGDEEAMGSIMFDAPDRYEVDGTSVGDGKYEDDEMRAQNIEGQIEGAILDSMGGDGEVDVSFEEFDINDNPLYTVYVNGESNGIVTVNSKGDIYDYNEDYTLGYNPSNFPYGSLNEASDRKVDSKMWSRMDAEQQMDSLLTVFKDPDDAEIYVGKKWDDLPEERNFMSTTIKPLANEDVDSKSFDLIQAIADKYSYDEILDALESFYTKTDNRKSALMARVHAKEFRRVSDMPNPFAKNEGADIAPIVKPVKQLQKDIVDFKLTEGYSLESNEVALVKSLRNQIDQGVLNSKMKDSFVKVLDGILSGYQEVDMDKIFMKGKMSDEEMEDLETRADDYFSEPIKEWVGGELEKRNNVLYDELVPGQGNSEFIEGEMLRAINKIIYRYYNDGDFFYKGYGTETAGPAHSFLINSKDIPLAIQSTLQSIFTKIMQSSGDEEQTYERATKMALKQIVDFVEAKNGNYTPSNEDMLSYTSEYEDEEDYEDDYDDYYDDEDDDY